MVVGLRSLTHFKVKTLAPLRSSERKKVVDQIISEYRLELPNQHLAEHDANATLGIGVVRNSLLPEGSLWAKFSTTVGFELKTIMGTVYVGSHPGEDQRILWFKVDEQVYPSGWPRDLETTLLR